jgi:hypothetical protein
MLGVKVVVALGFNLFHPGPVDSGQIHPDETHKKDATLQG